VVLEVLGVVEDAVGVARGHLQDEAVGFIGVVVLLMGEEVGLTEEEVRPTADGFGGLSGLGIGEEF
jgi:chloramphenicol 3-O-phosphotransferase